MCITSFSNHNCIRGIELIKRCRSMVFSLKVLVVIMAEGNGEARTMFYSLRNNLCCFFSLFTWYREILDFVFFIFSTMLYSMVSETIKVFDVGEVARILDVDYVDWLKYFLDVPFSFDELFGPFWIFFFVSVGPSLCVLIRSTYSSSSVFKVVRIKSHIIFSSIISSPYISSVDIVPSSSPSSSKSSLDIWVGGWDWKG